MAINQNENLTYEIKPPRGLIGLNFKEIWQYRELLYILIWRNIKVRYKQTLIGAAWAVVQPLFTMMIFTVIFSYIARIPSDNVPYPIFVYTGLIYWNFFTAALMGANGSLIENQGIIKKIYFPRLIIPFSTTVTPIIDFALVLIILFGLMIYFHQTPNLYGIFLIPVLIIITFCGATGLGLIFTSINAKYRDIQYIVGFIVQVLFYATPIIYPLTVIPERYQWLMHLNPMAGVIIVARSSLFGNQAIAWPFLLSSAIISIIFFIIGLFYFRKSEKIFADIL